MAWDWNLVGELVLSLAVGIGVGGGVAAHFFEVAALRVAAHPSVRKIANAADRITAGTQNSGWAGLLQSGLNFLTGGQFSKMQGGGPMGLGGYAPKAIVINEEGKIVGEAELSQVHR